MRIRPHQVSDRDAVADIRLRTADSWPTTPSEVTAHLMRTPERVVVPELVEHPAHLRIDLLPEHQRAGTGRR